MSIVDRSMGRWGMGRVGGRRRGPRKRPRGVIGLEVLEVRVVPSGTSTWSGLGTTTNWSDSGNWDDGGVPSAGDNIVFPAGASNLTNIDDITNTTDASLPVDFGSLTIAGSGYSISAVSGNSASFTSIDASQTSGSSEVDIPITLAGAAVSVDTSGAEFVLGGVLSGSAGLTMTGPGTLDLTADNNYTGTTTVNSGTLLVDGSQGGSTVDVASGATLGGVGAVGTITATGATVAPGDIGAAGVLTDTGDLDLGTDADSNNSTYSVVIDGTTAGDGSGDYGQTQVDGAINFTGATLSITLGPDFTPSVPASFTIIDNMGSDGVTGTFDGLSEGATIEVPYNGSDITFSISYVGGAASDSVVLTEMAASATALTATTTSAVYGQLVVLTATVTGPTGDATPPTGTVDFYNGSTLLENEPIVDGVATLNTTALPVATNSITADYLGDTNYLTSTSSPATMVTVSQASANVALSASSLTPGLGDTVTLTATVSAASPGSGTPTGTVQFYNGSTALGSPVTLSGGIASLPTSSLTIGANSITADYSGDPNFNAANSTPIIVTVGAEWTGADSGNSSDWSDADNWAQDTPPSAGDNIVFPSGASSFTSNNDLGANISYGSLIISGSGYTITGDSDSFTSIDASLAPGSSTVSMPVTLMGLGTVSVDQSGAELVLGGIVSGSVGLTMNGPGTLDLTAANNYTGATTVNSGTLLVDGTQGASPVNVASGATLGGVGTVGTITATGATVDPGDNGLAGVLTDTGSLNLGPNSSADNSTYTVVIDGSTAGDGSGDFSQTQVAGTINLTGATLDVTLGPDFTPSIPTSFTIIDNTGSSAVNGTFNGLAQGSTIVVSGVTFAISYTGGTNGNSVVLTEVYASTTTVSYSPTSPTPVYGQSIDLMATVSGPNGAPTPSGTVEFFNGSTELGTQTLEGGAASLPVTSLPVGTNSITVQYLGDSNYAGSTSSPATMVTVVQATATVSLTVFPTSPVSQQSVTFTATIAAVAPGAGTPTGTVEFMNGSSSLGSGTISDGVATITTTLTTGDYSVTAVYQGDTNFETGATSPAVPVTVTAAATTTTTLTPTTNSPVLGQSVTFNVTVAPISPATGTPTGTVEFFNGTTLLQTVMLSGGAASYSTSDLPLGANSISAVYSGDDTFTSSISGSQTVTVGAASTATVVTYAPGSPVAGQNVTLTATVTAVSPGSGTPSSGTVQFYSNNGSTLLGSANLTDGVATFTTSSLLAGANSVDAVYESTSSDFNGSTSPFVTITLATTATSTTTVTFTPSSPVYGGEDVTLTATVAPVSPLTGTPTGTVQFYNGTTPLGSPVTISGGVASLAPMALPAGANAITAQYSGDSTFTSSTSPVTTVTVGLATTTTTVTFSPSTPVYGESVVLTATITSTSTGADLPTGTVTFYNGSTALGSPQTVTNGVATLDVNTLPASATNSITAQYSGDSNYAASTSAAVTVPVSQSSSATTVTFFPTYPVSGQNVTLTASVSAVSPGAGLPTGTIQFYNGTTAIGSPVTLSGGVASLTTTALVTGPNAITAQYSGDTNFIGSTSPPVTVTLAPTATSTTTVTFSPAAPSYGELVTLTATVAPISSSTNTPSGTVEFFNGTTYLGTGILSTVGGVQQATFQTSTLPVSPSNSITAQYSGDTNFTSSTSSPVTVPVTQISTTTVLTYIPSSPSYGTSVTFTATITPASTGAASPTGTVTFYSNYGSSDQETLASDVAISNDIATYTTSTLSVGSIPITAVYSGDTNYAGSTSTPATVVTITESTTSVAVTYSPAMPVYGQVVILTATITPSSTGGASPTGTVDFFNGTTFLGSGTVSNDVATLDTTALPVGTTSVTAQYLGDANFSGSTSPVDAFAIVLAGTTTTLTVSSTNPAAFASVTLTATVAVTSPGVATPTGTVEFFANGTPVGTATVSNGQAVLSVVLPITVNAVTAEYLGSSVLETSTSPAVTVSVGTANDQWLNQVYEIEVGRAPTQAELTKANNQLASGVSRKVIVSGIANSAEAKAYLVDSTFEQYLGVQPTNRQVRNSFKQVDYTNTSLTAVILGSKQFYEQSGGTLESYLAALETAVLGTTTQEPGLTAQLESGVSLTTVANELIESNLGKASLFGTSYTTIFGSDPSHAQDAGYVSLMNRGVYLRQIVASLLAGNRFYKQSTTST